jgi:hypothetical protein
MTLLTLALVAALQAPELAVHPGDPLHRLVEVEVEAGLEAAPIKHLAHFEGTL